MKGINRFASNMLEQLEKEKNIFFSPLSITLAMRIAAAGAKGQTKTEIEQVFNFPSYGLGTRAFQDSSACARTQLIWLMESLSSNHFHYKYRSLTTSI